MFSEMQHDLDEAVDGDDCGDVYDHDADYVY
jgi:hypothetical protein